MKTNYCLPIIKKTQKEVEDMITANENGYSYIEVWVDYIEDLEREFIDKLKERLGSKLIILLRRQNLEEVKMGFEKRREIIDALENSESFLDLDIKTQTEELQYLNGKQIKLILSYHNYQETPENAALFSIIEEMKSYHPEVLKVSTFCKSEEDSLRLLEVLLSLKKEGFSYIILGMGEKGVSTRILGPLWGNKMSFAPKSLEEASAPGQLTQEELEKVFEGIKEHGG